MLVQRVSEASVSVNGRRVSEIENGFLVFAGFYRGENEAVCARAAEKLLCLRIFEDDKGKMNKNITEVNGQVLLVSQFTLCAETKKGNRPSFDRAMESNEAAKFFNMLFETLSKSIVVKQGEFKSLMDVSLVNHGPATFMLEIE